MSVIISKTVTEAWIYAFSCKPSLHKCTLVLWPQQQVKMHLVLKCVLITPISWVHFYLGDTCWTASNLLQSNFNGCAWLWAGVSFKKLGLVLSGPRLQGSDCLRIFVTSEMLKVIKPNLAWLCIIMSSVMSKASNAIFRVKIAMRVHILFICQCCKCVESAWVNRCYSAICDNPVTTHLWA